MDAVVQYSSQNQSVRKYKLNGNMSIFVAEAVATMKPVEYINII